MLFMVIENFRNRDADAVYRRLREKGRMLPDGVTFISSWVSADLGRCFQVLDCDEAAMLQEWVARWSDLVEFEVIAVVEGKETGAIFARIEGRS
jgi:hypothetical protein